MDWPLPIRILLLPLSWIYGLIVRSKTLLYATGVIPQKRLKGAVISVGNLTVGGTGKTPMVIWLANRFLAEGKRVAILSRGYRGAQGTSDEVELLKRRLGPAVRFGVGPDRFAEGQKLEAEEAVDVFLLDDGFQHLKLARDVNILMLERSRERRSKWLLPAGPMREPFSAWRRADLLVAARGKDDELAALSKAPRYCARTRLLGFRKLGDAGTPNDRTEIGIGPWFAFCGIGNPAAFFEDLERWNVELAGTKAFRDHHSYSASDAAGLEALAANAGAEGLVTTEKDEQNLKATKFAKLPVYVAPIEFDVSEDGEFVNEIDRILSARKGGAS
jgi:tetraacyldisaccharide 4'-kinase